MPLAVVGTLLLTAVACNRTEVFMHYESTSTEHWYRKDTLAFDVPPLAADGRYAQTLHVRTTQSTPYPFTTLYIEVAQTWTDSTALVDTVACNFVERNGSATGVALRQYAFPFRQLERQKGDSAHITLRHVMLQDSVSGISDVGLSLERDM